MELVAAEPMVQSPVAASFDADGNLYVAEMRDYPYKPKPGNTPMGTVRLLRDTDGDGRFDRSTVFADGLLWAAGIAPWKDGVFVTAPPDIWYLKDTDGDDRSDVRKKVYTGFGTQNQQAMVNNLAWGLDHFIYGAASGNGGTIRPGDDPKAPGVSVEHSDFRFDPVSGPSNWSRAQPVWQHVRRLGNRFTCNESHPLSQPVLPRGSWRGTRISRSPRPCRISPGAPCRSSGSARLSVGDRSARAGGSPIASGPPDRRA